MTEQKQNEQDGDDGIDRLAALPKWFPPWARQLAELYFSGTTSMFVVHGNTFDFTQLGAGEQLRFGTLGEFLAEQLFGRWDLVLHYDLARGLRCAAGADRQRLQQMVTLANRKIGDLSQLSKTPSATLAVLDRFVQKNVMAEPDKRVSVAVLIDHASYLVPRGDRLGLDASRHLVTLINWATSPYVKRLNMTFVLADDRLSGVADRLVANPHVAAIEVPLPDAKARTLFLKSVVGDRDPATFSDFGTEQLATLTAGIALTDLHVVVQSAVETGRRLDQARFRDLKKRLIERQAQDLLEFIEPSWDLDTVVGHEAAKRRLREDADLIRRGRLETVPMGYLLCGPVGTGKSFLAQCAAGTIGIPVVQLKNFRSKFVGESEGNLERVLNVLRGMGPVAVVIDEADAMLGDRSQSGDSGVGSRIFGMIAAQMGNTAYRGRIVWMLLTARPDLLPIDLKRQGRAEVHIPLFYPTEDHEVRKLFTVLARKNGAELAEADLPENIPQLGNLSGADIEGIVGRAWRKSLLAGADRITATALAEVVAGFLPSAQSAERELQELAAIIECTDIEFLPQAKRDELEELGGRGEIQRRLSALKQLIAAE